MTEAYEMLQWLDLGFSTAKINDLGNSTQKYTRVNDLNVLRRSGPILGEQNQCFVLY